MYISAGWRNKQLSLSLSRSLSPSLSEEKPNLHGLYNLCLFFYEISKTLKKYIGSIYVEPALNHEMVRAVLTERQTSDCDVKCRITFITKGNYCRRMWNSKHWVRP